MKSEEKDITIWEGVKRGVKGLIDFEGKSGRKEYLSYIIVLLLIFIALFILTFKLFEIPDDKVNMVTDGFFWGFSILSLAATFRRYQDINKAGVIALAIPAAIYFNVIISRHPFEGSHFVYLVCLGVLTYCLVLLMSKRKD